MKQAFLILVALLVDYGCDGRAPAPIDPRAELDRQGVEYTEKSFLASAESGKVDIVKMFLAAGMNPDSRGASNQTASMEAARAGSAGVLQVLLESGANIRLTDDDGRTALHFAAAALTGAPCARLLLDYGADPNAKTRTGSTPIFEAVSLFPSDTAPVSRFLSVYIETITVLLDRGADVNAQNLSGFSPLMRAAASGNAPVARLLIERGADVSATDNRGWTPLRYAVENDNTEVALVIRAAGR